MARVLVTAALPYANGPLHLGHIRSTYLPADIYARFQRLIGNDAIYVCATDEHGTPIVASAEKAGKTPEQFVDFYHSKDKEEFEKLGFSFDIFYHTHSPENTQMTQYFYNRLNEGGYMYTKDVEQAYCEHCKRFLPDRFVIGTCPYCGAEGIYSDYCEMCGKALQGGELKFPQCITCKSTPTAKTSKHYFLKLGEFSDRLAKWLSSNKNLQKEVVNYVSNWVKEGLNDWDLSRDMKWGVPIPGEEDKVFYVWFDAPIGYVSSTVKWAKDNGKKWEDYWHDPETRIVHFIGKDIIYHHFLFWPAMLMGVGNGFRAPDFIPTRGYLNLEGGKFSKSKGWFVSLGDFLEAFEPDYLRYYQTEVTGYDVQDADFVWKEFQSKVNNELVANFGNFVHRAVILTKKKCSGKVPDSGGLDERDQELLKKIDETRDIVSELVEKIELRRAQQAIFALSSDFNKYLSDKEPWKEKNQDRIDSCLYVCLRGVTALAIMAEPFLPFTSRKLFSMLELPESELKWANVSEELLKPGTELPDAKPLFEKVSDEEIAEQEEKLKKKIDIHISVTPEAKEYGINFKAALIRGVRVSNKSAKLESMKKLAIPAVERLDLADNEILNGFKELYKKSGAEGNVPSAEKLVGLVKENGMFPNINTIVDTYNLVAVEKFLSIGAHDATKIKGDVKIKVSDGTERYVPLGKAEPAKLKPGEYVFVDGEKVICRMDVKQCNESKITKDTRDVFLYVQGNKLTSDKYLEEALEKICKLIVEIAGGEVEKVGEG